MRSGFLGRGIGPSTFGGGGVPADPVPVAGAELIVNGDFSAWTGDNPDGWTVTGEVGSDPMITQVAGGMRYYTTSVTTMTIAQSNANLVRGAWLVHSARASAVVAGTLYFTQGGGIISSIISTLVTFGTVRWISSSGDAGFRRRSGLPVDVTIESASLRSLATASLLSTRAYASPDCDLSAQVTRTAGTQAGLVARLDSDTSPANFIIAYLDGGGGVQVDKCVAGTYTNVIGGLVTYAAGSVLRLLCAGNDVSCYYNGAQVGSTVTVSDAGIVSNVRHGKFSTYASNTLAGYTAA